jgi:hypothetical protein
MLMIGGADAREAFRGGLHLTRILELRIMRYIPAPLFQCQVDKNPYTEEVLRKNLSSDASPAFPRVQRLVGLWEDFARRTPAGFPEA